MAESQKNPNGGSEQKPEEDARGANGKPSVKLVGTVEKLIPSVHPSEPEKAQIAIEGAEHLYREIRVPNTLQGGGGKEVALKKGEEVDVTIEAGGDSTAEKRQGDRPPTKTG